MLKKIIVCLSLVFVLTASLSAQAIGQITYIDGTVSLTRSGQVINQNALDVGYAIQNLDQIRTGRDGGIEVELNSNGLNARIRIDANACYAINRSDVAANRSSTGIELLTGRVAMAVNNMTNGSEFNVRTRSAVMGVRGTEFTVDTGAQGEVLVACPTGRVECRDGSRNAVYAEPGQVVQQDKDARMSTAACRPEDVETFRSGWVTARFEEFRVNALPVLRNFITLFDQLSIQFDGAYGSVEAQREIIARWEEEDRTGRRGNVFALTRDKLVMLPLLVSVQLSLYVHEFLYFRLLDLLQYVDQGVGVGDVGNGRSTADFARSFNAQSVERERRYARVRYLISMYSARNNGTFPTDLFNLSGAASGLGSGLQNLLGGGR